MRKVKHKFTLKSGLVISEGTSVAKIEWGKGNSRLLTDVYLVSDKSTPIRMHARSVVALISGFKRPSLKQLEKMSADAIATTPTGKRIEVDGFGPDGSPSWFLVLGYV